MAWGRSRRNSNSSLLHSCLILISAIGISACGTVPFIPTSATNLAPCTLDKPGVNIYQVGAVPAIPTIFQYSATATPLPPPQTPIPEPPEVTLQKSLGARSAAFRRLQYEVMRWTETQSIKLDDQNEVYILVTFLSPELVQAVYLNNLLKNNTQVLDINSALASALGQFAARNEMIFFMTVIPVKSDGASMPHTLTINGRDLKLKNTEGLSISPTHNDDTLVQTLDLSQPIFGYVSYPLAVTNPDNMCTQVLNRTFNTKIVLQMSSIHVDGANSNPLTWNIPYSPLLDTGNPIYIPDFTIPTDSSNLSPLKFSPSTSPDSQNSNEFWQNFTRFVWGQITLEIY